MSEPRSVNAFISLPFMSNAYRRIHTDEIPRGSVAYGMQDSIQATCVIDGLLQPKYILRIPTAEICDPVRFVGSLFLLILRGAREYEY